MFAWAKRWWKQRKIRHAITDLRARWQAFYRPMPFASDVALGRQVLDFMEQANIYLADAHQTVWRDKNARNSVIITAVAIELDRAPVEVMKVVRAGAGELSAAV